MTTIADLPERIHAKIMPVETGCWLWTGAVNSKGYGAVRWGKSQPGAHRVTYELLVGPIPDGLQIDHLCRVRSCVNPDHLEPVTQQENLRRGESTLHQTSKTHCPQGHPYAGYNVYVSNGGRKCRTCGRKSKLRRYYQAKKRKG